MTLRSIVLGLSLLSVTGCTKPSERAEGVGEQPSNPYQNSPSTLPTQGAATSDAAVGDAELTPQEMKDRPGTTRTPAAVGGDAPADAGT